MHCSHHRTMRVVVPVFAAFEYKPISDHHEAVASTTVGPEPEASPGNALLGLGLFKIYHRTRSNVAMESSTEECPTEPPPAWIKVPRCSFALFQITVQQHKQISSQRLTDPSVRADMVLPPCAETVSQCPRIGCESSAVS